MNTRNPHRPEDSIEIGFTVIPHPGDLGLQSNLRKALRMLAFQGGSPRNLGGCGSWEAAHSLRRGGSQT
jgi:hypothetical protein